MNEADVPALPIEDRAVLMINVRSAADDADRAADWALDALAADQPRTAINEWHDAPNIMDDGAKPVVAVMRAAW